MGNSRVAARAILFCLTLVFAAPLVIAQNARPADLDPLRPADTSSPRATLNSFLSDARRFVGDFREKKQIERSYLAYRRASQTLDFSASTEGDTWFFRGERIAMLYELLARIKLPPQKDIPGDAEVARGDIVRWTIPGTQITIAKMPDGLRAGEFLFSADTVQSLDRLYRQAKDLPYQPGFTPGVYEQLLSGGAAIAHDRERQLRSRLKPVDTSSPRATLEDFLATVNRAYKLAEGSKDALRAVPPEMTRDEAREAERAAIKLLERASDTFDLHEIPPALRHDLSIQAVQQLKEVFDRTLLPPLDAIPDARTVEAARREGARADRSSARPFRWRFPNSQIEIVEIQEGEQEGQFLFSAQTIKRISDIYRRVKDLPYRRAQFGGTELEYRSPELSPNLYENYLSGSGHLIPRAHFLGRIAEALPAPFKTVYGGQLLWQWIAFAFCVLLTVVAAYAVQRFIRRSATRIKAPQHDWLRVLAPIAFLLLVVMMGRFIDENLNFTGAWETGITTAVRIIGVVLAAWVAFVFCEAVSETIVAMPRMRGKISEAALLRVAARVIGFLIGVWILVAGVRNLGADLLPLLAGLGIGGFAVALAAQSTIANFIGGLILLATKPVRVGDFCRYGEDPSGDWLRIGTVEEISWMSTRIRGIDRTVTTIPNASFSTIHIVNFNQRDQRLLKTTLQLRYETTPEQMRYILVKLRELLLGHPMVNPDPARVRLVGYGAYSKDVEIFCYLRCVDQNEFLAAQEDLLLRMGDIVQEAGSGFAYPSQTTYIARDTGLDADKAKRAEGETERWRASGKLPFPEFEREERDRMKDILDYPPEGSPDYRPRVGGPSTSPRGDSKKP